MHNETLWEAICSLAGAEGNAIVTIAEATNRSAVTEGIADVEIKRFIEDQLVTPVGPGQIRLTNIGRESCAGGHHTAVVTGRPD